MVKGLVGSDVDRLDDALDSIERDSFGGTLVPAEVDWLCDSLSVT